MFKDQGKFSKDYKVAVIKNVVYGAPPPQRTRSGWVTVNKRSTRHMQLNLHFWCLNPAVAFLDLQETHSIILTSGTLSPMTSFSSELGMSFPIQLEASHVIKNSQVWVGSVGQGPSQEVIKLNIT